MACQVQFEDRLHRWADAHPEHRSVVTSWLERFKQNPVADDLEPIELPDDHNQDVRCYLVPPAPLAVVAVLNRPKTHARILRPRDPDEVVPMHDRLD